MEIRMKFLLPSASRSGAFGPIADAFMRRLCPISAQRNDRRAGKPCLLDVRCSLLHSLLLYASVPEWCQLVARYFALLCIYLAIAMLQRGTTSSPNCATADAGRASASGPIGAGPLQEWHNHAIYPPKTSLGGTRSQPPTASKIALPANSCVFVRISA